MRCGRVTAFGGQFGAGGQGGAQLRSGIGFLAELLADARDPIPNIIFQLDPAAGPLRFMGDPEGADPCRGEHRARELRDGGDEDAMGGGWRNQLAISF